MTRAPVYLRAKLLYIFAPLAVASTMACSSTGDQSGSTDDELTQGAGWQGPERYSLGESGAKLDMATAYWMGRMADLAYSPRATVERTLAQLGVTTDRLVFFENTRTNTQGFYFSRGDEAVVAFRGTQELRDFLTDAKTWTRATPMGKIHAGFLSSFESVWKDDAPGLTMSDGSRGLAALLRAEHKPRLLVTGHSLGAALATLAFAHAGYDGCLRNVTATDPRTLEQRSLDPCFERGLDPRALYTFGSPRVGDATFSGWVAALAREPQRDRGIFRFVNAADGVAKVPDTVKDEMFIHTSSLSVSGKQTELESLVYLTRAGAIDTGGASVEYATEKWRTRWLDWVGDHFMKGYLTKLLAHASERGKPSVPPRTATKLRFDRVKRAYERAQPKDFVTASPDELGGPIARSTGDLVLRWSTDVGTFFVRRSTDGAVEPDRDEPASGQAPVADIAPIDTDEIFDGAFELVATVEVDRSTNTILRFEDTNDPTRR